MIGLMGDDPEGSIVPVGQGRTFKQANSLIINSIKEKMNEKRQKILQLQSFPAMKVKGMLLMTLKENLKVPFLVKILFTVSCISWKQFIWAPADTLFQFA